MEDKVWDVVIVGAGPAGLSAGIYARRAGLAPVLLERGLPGGQLVETDAVENYPGFPEPIPGPELMDRMRRQAERLGAEIVMAEAKALSREGGLWRVEATGKAYLGRTVILAMGARHRELTAKGAKELTGRGVSYCATCDGDFFAGQDIAVIGGGNSAVEEAIFLTKFAKRVYVIHRRDALRAEKIVQERAFANPKIEFVWNHVPVRINGDGAVTGIEIENVKSGERRQLPVDGVFIYVGMEGNTGFLRGLVALDERGFVQAGEDTVTSCPGLFAAGDVRQKLLRQVVTATADGAVAAVQAGKYIEGNFS